MLRDARRIAVTLASTLAIVVVLPAAASARSFPRPIDPQSWELPEHMTWSDYHPIPGVDYSKMTPTRTLHAALILGDFQDQKFRAAETTVDPTGQRGLGVKDPAQFYLSDLFTSNSPTSPQHGFTVNDFWMEDSYGTIGVDARAFGPYTLDGKMYQYGIGDFGQPSDCPDGPNGCSSDFDSEILQKSSPDVEAAQNQQGEFDFRFLLHAGYDESGMWLNYGMAKFPFRNAVTDLYGPPNPKQQNWAHTRYVDWTSFFAAEQIWSHAIPGALATEGESDGGSVYAHEMTHVLGVLDNYNNPYANPPQRAFGGPWDTMDRGAFNGPGGPWARDTIPPDRGGTMASEHMLRNKIRMGFLSASEVNTVSRDELSGLGIVKTTIIQRETPPKTTDPNIYSGMRIVLGQDNSSCDTSKPKCDGGGYDFYDVEVVNREGFDSFLPDHGVIISKSKAADASPFIWVIDSHPKDLHRTDYVTASGRHVPYTVGDYRQLADAAFHAGTGPNVVNHYVDKANGLEIFVLDTHSTESGLVYTVAAESLATIPTTKPKISKPKGAGAHGAHLVTFKVTNPGSQAAIFKLRLKARGLKTQLPNDLVYVAAGATQKVSAWVKGPARAGALVLKGRAV